MKMTLLFTQERETKGAVRYQEVNEAGEVENLREYAIGTLYLRKSALKEPWPKALRITIDFVEGQ